MLLLAITLVLAPFVRAWVEQRGRINALSSSIEQSQHSVAELKAQEQRWKDPNYIVTQARKRFTYVMPGEVGYVLVDTPHAVADERDPSAAAARQVATSKGSWVGTMWDSVAAAGEAPADPAGSSSASAAP